MRNLNLYFWLIVLAGMITSCSRDEAAGPQNNESNRVRIGTSIDQALRTRAPSVTVPANHQLRYVLEVWDTETPSSLVYRDEKVTKEAPAVVFDFVLTEAGDYKAMVWADFIPKSETGSEVATPNNYTHYADHHYVTNTASGLKAVALAKTGVDYVINDDARDAFFACIAIKKETGALEKDVQLKRPFGQINIIEKNTALLDKVQTMTLAYTVPGQFNVETGTTEGALVNAKPAVSTLPTAATDRKANLFYDFIFAPATGQTSLGEIALEFESNNAHITLPPFTIPANMPVVRNKRTNISGSILQANSNEVKLTVAVSDAWTLPDEEKDTYFSISNAEQLKTFRDKVNNGDTYQGKTVRLTADIDLQNEEWLKPIGTDDSKPFRGTFEGDGYHIKNLNVNTNAYAGLFGYLSGGKVSKLRVSGKVKTTGLNVGGIAGRISGGCTVENCIFDGNVSGQQFVGGIVGASDINSRIAGCYTKGNITATLDVAGGIAGSNASNCTLTGCYSEAEVKVTNKIAGGIAGKNLGGNITYCYATGKVSGQEYVGGILGYQSAGSVADCIALNPDLTRTEGGETTFGRVVGNNQSNGTVDNCGAFNGMTIKDATSNATITSGATSVAGDNLTREQCVTGATYSVNYGISWDSGWNAGSETPLTYLPWIKAFESFPGISETDYRISVPAHLSSSSTGGSDFGNGGRY